MLIFILEAELFVMVRDFLGLAVIIISTDFGNVTSNAKPLHRRADPLFAFINILKALVDDFKNFLFCRHNNISLDVLPLTDVIVHYTSISFHLLSGHSSIVYSITL